MKYFEYIKQAQKYESQSDYINACLSYYYAFKFIFNIQARDKLNLNKLSNLQLPDSNSEPTVTNSVTNPFQIFLHGLQMLSGLGTNAVNPLDALCQIKIAADLGSADAQWLLGYYFMQMAPKTKENENTGFQYYLMAANQDDLVASIDVADCYENGKGVNKNQEQAFNHYQKSADQNMPRAQFNLGRCYEEGIHVAKDTFKAFHLYKLAADQEYAEAEFKIGMCLAEGQGTTQDVAKAFKYIKKSADHGCSKAQREVGNYYTVKSGVIKRNEVEAFKYFKMAAEQNDSYALSAVAICYKKGVGVEKNEAEALKYMRLAAGQGNIMAAFHLADYYVKGVGTPVKLGEATKIYFEIYFKLDEPKKKLAKLFINMHSKYLSHLIEKNENPIEYIYEILWFEKSRSTLYFEIQSLLQDSVIAEKISKDQRLVDLIGSHFYLHAKETGQHCALEIYQNIPKTSIFYPFALFAIATSRAENQIPDNCLETLREIHQIIQDIAQPYILTQSAIGLFACNIKVLTEEQAQLLRNHRLDFKTLYEDSRKISLERYNSPYTGENGIHKKSVK